MWTHFFQIDEMVHLAAQFIIHGTTCWSVNCGDEGGDDAEPLDHFNGAPEITASRDEHNLVQVRGKLDHIDCNLHFYISSGAFGTIGVDGLARLFSGHDKVVIRKPISDRFQF